VIYNLNKVCPIRVTLDCGAVVSLVSQELVAQLGLRRSHLQAPTLSIYRSDLDTPYSAYKLRLRLTDDYSATREINIIACGVDKSGPEILLGNPDLIAGDIEIACGSQTWRWGISNKTRIEFISLEELEAAPEQIHFIRTLCWNSCLGNRIALV
jgi:hypothetical protein